MRDKTSKATICFSTLAFSFAGCGADPLNELRGPATALTNDAGVQAHKIDAHQEELNLNNIVVIENGEKKVQRPEDMNPEDRARWNELRKQLGFPPVGPEAEKEREREKEKERPITST